MRKLTPAPAPDVPEAKVARTSQTQRRLHHQLRVPTRCQWNALESGWGVVSASGFSPATLFTRDCAPCSLLGSITSAELTWRLGCEIEEPLV